MYLFLASLREALYPDHQGPASTVITSDTLKPQCRCLKTPRLQNTLVLLLSAFSEFFYFPFPSFLSFFFLQNVLGEFPLAADPEIRTADKLFVWKTIPGSTSRGLGIWWAWKAAIQVHYLLVRAPSPLGQIGLRALRPLEDCAEPTHTRGRNLDLIPRSCPSLFEGCSA